MYFIVIKKNYKKKKSYHPHIQETSHSELYEMVKV